MAGEMLICGAVEGELAGVLNGMDRIQSGCIGRRQIFAGRLKGIQTRLILSGPGVPNAAQALTAAIENRRPRMLLMIGCAGAFEGAGMRVGDIGVATEEIDAHLGIEGPSMDAPPTPLPFPVLTAEGMDIPGRYPLHPMAKEVQERLNRRFRAESFRVKAGPFLTVSTVTASDQRAGMLYNAFGPLMENMEGAGGGHVAALYGIPFLEIRCASNRVGNRDRASWELSTTFDRCTRAVLALTDFFKKKLNS